MQEQNARPGSANRLVGRWSRRIYLGSPGGESFFPVGRSVLTGNPVRAAFVRAAATAAGDAALNGADVPAGVSGRRVLVFGGSRGAHTLNTAVVEAASAWCDNGAPSLWIQTGVADLAAVRSAYGLDPAVQPC